LFYEMPGTDGNLGRLSAYETNTMRPVWSFQQRSPFLTGVISTAGGVDSSATSTARSAHST
jgi:alcohol dehydrogenase (cytochrome c)